MRLVMLVTALLVCTPRFHAQDVDALHKPLDELLDINVRDGFVYYNALRGYRARLDGYIRALDGPTALAHARGSREQQLALWINAYNAFVLHTVVSHYPIQGRSAAYPPNSIRQIPGAFDKRAFRAAGRNVTLDQVEKEILEPLGDARAILALGRGAIGSGRLRSEAYNARKVEEQLAQVAAESVRRHEVVHINAGANTLSVSPMFSWRESLFVATFAKQAHAIFKQRSPLERAVLGLIEPHVLVGEAEFLEKNMFKMVFHDFDWRLNDLSNRPQ